jgi:DNA (cytosine-5)-methyltransferase 1
MRLLDLFSGIGGFSLAAHWLGWKTTAFVERDEFCQKVLRKNFKDIPVYGDITTFSGESFRGNIDIITGGFPCQPFSQAGKREGRDDERHLFPHMLRVIQEVRPRWVVAENVRGILSIESGSVFAEVVSSLESEGYEVITFCIPASAVNAPHRRDRIWFIAHAEGLGRRNGIAEDFGQTEREIDSSGDEITRLDGESFITDSDYERYIGRREQSEVDERQIREGCGDGKSFGEPSISDSGIAGTFANTPLVGYGFKGQDGEPERSISKEGGLDFERNGQIIADTNGERLQRRRGNLRGKGAQSNDEQSFRRDRNRAENWLEAATQLCVVDDGLPRGLVRPKGWRVNALKAAGNTIVPQIAFEIFKAIEAAEKANV